MAKGMKKQAGASTYGKPMKPAMEHPKGMPMEPMMPIKGMGMKKGKKGAM